MQDKPPLLVDQYLIELLAARNGTPLSTTEIRDLYLTEVLAHENVDANELRKYIYRELRRLDSANVIERYNGATGRGCRFSYRGEPEDRSFEIKASPFVEMTGQREETTRSMDTLTFKALKDELSQRKVELMASIGEAEEYQRLFNKFPALQKTVRPQYLESRDRSSKVLGQLRAVETILAEMGPAA